MVDCPNSVVWVDWALLVIINSLVHCSRSNSLLT